MSGWHRLAAIGTGALVVLFFESIIGPLPWWWQAVLLGGAWACGVEWAQQRAKS